MANASPSSTEYFLPSSFRVAESPFLEIDSAEMVAPLPPLELVAGGGAFGFDVVCGEAQSFGVAPGFGGPHLGFFACSEKHVRQMPGRLAGETVD